MQDANSIASAELRELLRRDSIPILIPAFNNPTYVRQMLARLRQHAGVQPVILDNDSSYQPMLRLYDELEPDVAVLRLGANLGPRAVWQDRALLDALPRHFCVTDPDLELGRDLPCDFITDLMRITEKYQVGKAGFALDLSDRERMLQTRFRHADGHHHIWESQASFWAVPLGDPEFADPLYLADIDTTFALYDKSYFDSAQPFDAIRVAGRFTCRHLPWYVDNGLPEDEESYYRDVAEYSYFLGNRPASQVRSLFARQDLAAGHAAFEPVQPDPDESPGLMRVAVGPARFYVQPGPWVDFWAAVGSHRWEPETFAVLDRFLHPGARFVDVGAWIGPTALYAATRARTVEAYECDPVAIRMLQRNLAANPALEAKIRLHEVALGDEDGSTRLWSRALGNSETSIFSEHERRGRVFACSQSLTVATRDALGVFRQARYAACPDTLVKIDVEGAEFRIVPRLRPLIRDSQCVWYISLHEFNINSPTLPTRILRLAETVSLLAVFETLHWYRADLTEVDQAAALRSIVDGTWRAGSALIFCNRPLR